MTYDFSLDRKSTFILGAGSVVLILLIFCSGFLAGMSWRREPQMAVVRPNPVTVAAAAPPPAANPNGSAGPPKGAAAPVNTEPVAPASPAVPPEPKPTAEAASAPAAAASTALPAAAAPVIAKAPPVAPEQSGVRLSIQVGSFLQKSNAEKLADQLKHSGYNPQIVLADIGTKQWNIVRVGPYQDWDEATQIAAQLSRDQAGRAVIRAIR